MYCILICVFEAMNWSTLYTNRAIRRLRLDSICVDAWRCRCALQQFECTEGLHQQKPIHFMYYLRRWSGATTLEVRIMACFFFHLIFSKSTMKQIIHIVTISNRISHRWKKKQHFNGCTRSTDGDGSISNIIPMTLIISFCYTLILILMTCTNVRSVDGVVCR